MPYFTTQALMYMGAYISINDWNQPWIFIFVVMCVIPAAEQLISPLPTDILKSEESVYFKFVLFVLLVIDWSITPGLSTTSQINHVIFSFGLDV